MRRSSNGEKSSEVIRSKEKNLLEALCKGRRAWLVMTNHVRLPFCIY